MNPLEVRLAEDRALRDALGAAFAGHTTDESAMEIVDEAVDYAEANRGRIAAAAAAIVLWFARAPLLNGLSRIFGLEGDDEEQDGDEARSDDD